jgi:hypothetical protein
LLAGEGAAGEVIHLNRAGSLEDEIEFEMREAASQLLLASLLDRAGVNGPYVTSGRVKQHLEKNRHRFPAFAAGADPGQVPPDIDFTIRQELAVTVQTEYQRARDQFLSQLKGSTTIDVPGTVDLGPVLTVTLGPSGRDVILSWPDSFTGFILEETARLAAPLNWSEVSTPVATTDGVNKVTLPSEAGARFYRLKLR